MVQPEEDGLEFDIATEMIGFFLDFGGIEYCSSAITTIGKNSRRIKNRIIIRIIEVNV